MKTTIAIAAIAALLTTPAIAFENNGPATASPLLDAGLTEAELFQARRALWQSYGTKTDPETVIGTYWQDLSGTADEAQVVKSSYVVGKGILSAN